VQERRARKLSEEERAVIAFERTWWRHQGAKERAIREGLGMSATRYYQILNAIIDLPAAADEDPLLVRRLRRQREARQRRRAARRSGTSE